MPLAGCRRHRQNRVCRSPLGKGAPHTEVACARFVATGGIGCDAGLNPRPRSVQMSTPQAVRAAIAALLSALLALLLAAGSASAATDHVVITGGAVVPAGQTAGDIVVVDGPVTDRRTRHGRCRIGQRAGPGHRPCRWRSDHRVGPSVPRSGSARRRRPALRRRAPRARARCQRGRQDQQRGLGRRSQRVGLGERVRVVAGGVGVDADRRRPARVAGAGRALRR